jgi:hypothetical protein
MRDAELLTEALLGVLSGSPEAATLAAYERTRDSLSNQLFAVTEAVAGFDWDLDRLRLLLREVNSAMADEMDYLQALPERRTSGPAHRRLRGMVRATRPGLHHLRTDRR